MRREPTVEMCAQKCGSKCCRAPLVLQVTDVELAGMMAIRPDVKHNGRSDMSIDIMSGTVVSRTTLTFANEPNQCCPFLDNKSGLCTVYEARPASCREFPDRPESWCLAWSD